MSLNFEKKWSRKEIYVFPMEQDWNRYHVCNMNRRDPRKNPEVQNSK